MNYIVKCCDVVIFNVSVEADSIEEAQEEAASKIRYGREIRVGVFI